MGRFSWLPTSSESEPDYDDGDYYEPERKGFLAKCYFCNGKMELQTDKDPRFAGRLFFRCAFAGNGEEHETKWWDESVTEEIEAIKKTSQEQTDSLKAVTVTNEGETIDHSEIFNRLKIVEGTVGSLRDEIMSLRQEISAIREGMNKQTNTLVPPYVATNAY